MITDSPCKRYLLALLLQGSTVQAVEDMALLARLDFGSIQYLCLLAETNLPPDPFRPRDKEHAPSQEFLERVGLQGEVPRFSRDAQGAFRLHTLPVARDILEVGSLGGASTAELVRLLHARRVKASPEEVDRYLHLFWDVQGCDRIQLRALLHLRSPDPTRAEAAARLDDIQSTGANGQGRVRLEIEQRGSAREVLSGAPADPLPLPHHTESPTSSDRALANTRRREGQRDLMRQLRRSIPAGQRAREEQAIKRAHYTDPRMLLSALPPSPLSVTISKAHMGLPLERIDMAKAIEIVEVMALHRLTEAMVSTHPEAAIRASSYSGILRQLQAVRAAYGASTDSLHNQIRAMALKLSTSGVYGDPSALTEGHHNLNPYSAVDMDALQETLGTTKKGKARVVETVGEESSPPPAPPPAPKPPPRPVAEAVAEENWAELFAPPGQSPPKKG